MVQKCANPACSSQFRSLRKGRVFVKGVESNADGSNKSRIRHLEYFWLCDSCCRSMTVIVEKGDGVRVAPLPAFAVSGQIAS
jgi:hypothetical protein